MWYKVHTIKEINHIYLQTLLLKGSNCFVCIVGVTLHALSSKIVIISKSWPTFLGVQTVKKQCSGCPNDTLEALVAKA